MTGKKLGRYDLIRVLGKGAMGLVYEGRDPNLDRRVAIKTIKVENLSEEAAAEYEARFRTEARSAARLQHPNIVSVYDSDRDGDIAFLVMEFIQGEDLKHHLDQGKRHTLQQTLSIMDDLLSALDYAHRAKIVHRDIKPANLLIEANGRVKLTDFGVARIQDSGDSTRTQGSMVGTLKYMSPEQVQGQPVDARSDLFAAGVVLYQLLTGQRPFDGDSDFAIIQRIVAHPADAPSTINTQLPAGLDAVVACALAKSRDQRYATAQDFAAALRISVGQAYDRTTVAPAPAPGSGRITTWTGTVKAGESLVDTQSGLGTGTSVVAQELELVYWKDVKESTDQEDLQGFLARFPTGVYADLARRRLRRLRSPGMEDPSGASRSGIALTPMPAVTASHERTEVLSRSTATPPPVSPTPVTPAPANTASGDPQPPADVDRAWDALGGVARPAKGSSNPVAPSAASVGGTAQAAAGGPPASPSPTETSDAAVQAPRSRRVLWWSAAVVAALVAVVGLRSLPDAGAPASESAMAPASAPAAAALPASAAVVAAEAPASLPTAAAPAASGPTLSSAPSMAATPSAASALQTAKGPAPLASAPSARASGTAIAVAAARKASDPAPVRGVVPAKPPSPSALPSTSTGSAATSAPSTPQTAATSSAGAPSVPAPHAEGMGSTAASGNPRQACEERSFISFQNCMAEQCAKPQFTNHAICVERRAMDQRRRDAANGR